MKNEEKSEKESSEDEWKRLEKWKIGRANYP